MSLIKHIFIRKIINGNIEGYSVTRKMEVERLTGTKAKYVEHDFVIFGNIRQFNLTHEMNEKYYVLI